MKIVTVIGARPQFVKAAAVSRVIAQTPGVTEVLVHTGQHYDNNMSTVFFEELGIPQPAHHLGIGSASQGAQTGRMLEAVERVLISEQPDWVAVYGDTNSTIAAALSAVKLHIPVAHVEAGLRSFNRRMPEEINRVVTDHVSSLLFPPTDTAVAHLKNEGIATSRIVKVGDVMYDTALFFRERAADTSGVLTALGLSPGQYVLATVHRAENTDDPARLTAIVGGLNEIAGELSVVLPLHPRTRSALQKAGLDLHPGMKVTDPVSYLDMVRLESEARLIVTDSGGVQKEAFFFDKLCVTLRDETEWVELLECGWNELLPPVDKAQVAKGVRAALARQVPESRPLNLYGNGRAAQAIVSAMCRHSG